MTYKNILIYHIVISNLITFMSYFVSHSPFIHIALLLEGKKLLYVLSTYKNVKTWENTHKRIEWKFNVA